jgi:hypothetical protein
MSTGVLYAQVIASLAAAAPPSYRAAGDAHRELPSHGAVSARLDLHAPSVHADLAVPEPAMASAASIPNVAHADALALQPAWHGDAPQLRDRTAAQELVHGMRRNGVPLARLWQGRGALFSVGLSPKGKPGLWFTKQLP